MFQKLKEVIKKQQFNPKLTGLFTNPFYFARKGLAVEIKKFAPEISGRVLDVGCGKKPYKEFFHYSDYIGLEIDSKNTRQNSLADIFYNSKTFPFRDNTFDAIVLNQVFEHVFTPTTFFNEIYRVLKPGGRLLITLPFVWDEHEQPYDYARYTSFGIAHILKSHDFHILHHSKTVNNIQVIFQLLNAYVFKTFSFKNKYINFLLTTPVFAFVNITGIIFNILLPANNDLYLDNVVLAEKVSNPRDDDE